MAQPETGRPLLIRLASFRVVYLAVVGFVLLSVVSIIAAEALLEAYFQTAIADAVRVDPNDGPVAHQIQDRVASLLEDSPWTQIGGVEVDAIVMGADNSSLYALGRTILPPPFSDPFLEANRLLPATADVFVSVPLDALLPGAILLVYAAALLQGLFVYNRAIARREQLLIDQAVAAREETARRAASIQEEVDKVRRRLAEVEPAEREQAEAIARLQSEREDLKSKLAALAEREAELRATAQRTTDLDQERQALEELLEEATDDLGQKDDEIRSLEDRLKRAAKGAPAARSRKSRETDQLAKRMRTLYKNVDFDDRALSDLAALGDEATKLRAEEAIKRLAEDPDTAAIRRKVGGLPPHLSIFELGFAGKGRVYYARAEGQRFRILAVGAKNTQKSDLDYLSRLG